MPKPYKKKPQARNGAPKNAFLSILIAFVAGYVMASFVSLSDGQAWLSKHVFNTSESGKQTKTKQKADSPKPQFEFYTLLSKERASYSSNQPTTPLKPAPEKPQAKKHSKNKAAVETAKPSYTANEQANTKTLDNTSYLVQIASFKRVQDAERMKATLILKGFNTTITNAKRDNTTWYRVIIGPYDNRMQAEKAQVEIAKSEHIMGMIRKMDA
jgi:cell division protein FtsN